MRSDRASNQLVNRNFAEQRAKVARAKALVEIADWVTDTAMRLDALLPPDRVFGEEKRTIDADLVASEITYIERKLSDLRMEVDGILADLQNNYDVRIPALERR
jgi:hypothetical protein